jgi:hypothetical protein
MDADKKPAPIGQPRFRRPAHPVGASFQVRGANGLVRRITVDGRTVDVWIPKGHSEHLLIAHDGQNVFDSRASTHHQTWDVASAAVRASSRVGVEPPVVAAVWNGSDADNPFVRGHELAPERVFRGGVIPDAAMTGWFDVNKLCGDAYMNMVADRIVPSVGQLAGIGVDRTKTAVLGASMGGLAALNFVAERSDVFSCALAYSVHWPIGGDALVDALLDQLPAPGSARVWMENGTTGLDRMYGPYQRRADDRLISRGYRNGRDFVSLTRRRSGHNEWSWARRLDQSLAWWLRD